MIILFFSGLSFFGLGLAAYLQMRQGEDIPLRKQLPWLAAFGLVCGVNSWVEMFLASGAHPELEQTLTILRILLQPLSGLLLLRFGYGVLNYLAPLPAWAVFIPGILIVPAAYLFTYAATTFVTPSPIEIPVDIWSRYLLYLPGSMLAGIGFLRQWSRQKKKGFVDVSKLMLGAGVAFLIEAFVVGFIVPAAPYGPASYYNYDRVVHNAFLGVDTVSMGTLGLNYERVLAATGLSIQFWRMLSAFAVTFFVVRGLDVFDTIRKRQLQELQEDRDRAQMEVVNAQIAARQTAESWTEALINISRQVVQLDNIDEILIDIVEVAQNLLDSDFVGVALLGEDQSSLMLKCHAHDEGGEVLETIVVVDTPFLIRAMRSNRSFRSQNKNVSGLLMGTCPQLKKPARTIAAVPLRMDNQPIGVLWAARCDEGSRRYTETDLIWLESIADQIVIAIQHGLMTSQLQSLSIVEERGRIAREMHDGLAQVLGYLNLQVQTLESLLTQGREEALQKEMRHMREAVKSAHADVRENILSLRTTLANEKGLLSSIDEYLEEFSIQTGMETSFSNNLGINPNLSSIAEVQLVCILQEALANVRKHARADIVRVHLSALEDQGREYIRIKIIDNGTGFQESQSKRSFGLQTMRERAASVNGKIEIESSLGSGTQIICQLPILDQEKLNNQSLFLDAGGIKSR